MTDLRAADGESITVLYVNDDDAFADLVGTKLERASSAFTVDVVRDAAAALEGLSGGAVDCVVTAYSLADGTGIDLIERVQRRSDPVPTVLFTGRGSERIASRATEANVSEYIPIRSSEDSFELLARRLRSLVEAERERRIADRMTERFRRTIERTTDAVYAVDSEWRIEYMNEKMAERVDRDREAVVGATLWEEFPSIRGTEFETHYRAAMEGGEPVSFEQYVGAPFDYRVEVRAFPDGDGLTVFSREVTADRERTRELERAEAILRQIHDVVFVVDDEYDVQFANAAAARMVDAPRPAAVEDKSIADVVDGRIPEADARQFYHEIDDTFTASRDGVTAGNYDTDLQLDFANGAETRTFDVRLTPFRSDERTEILVVARDVTERSERRRRLGRERDALREVQTAMADETLTTDDRLETLLEIGARTLDLDVGIVSTVEDAEYRVRAAHAPETDVGAGDAFALESTYCEEVLGQDAVRSFADAESAGKATHPAYTQFGLQSYIGAPLVVDGERYGTLNFSSPNPRPDSFESLEHTFVELLAELVNTELSQSRHRAELERQRFLFDRAQEIAEIGIWEYDTVTETLQWSDGVRRIHGVDDAYEPTLSDAIEFYHSDDVARITDAVERAIEDGEPYDLDLQIVRPDGEVREVRARGESVERDQPGGTVLRGIFQDITDRKEREREFRRLAEEYDALLSNSGDAIFLLNVDSEAADGEFRFDQLSPGYETQTGLTTEAVRGKTPREVFGDERGAELAANYRHCMEAREPITYQEELPVDDDARFWQTSLAPVVIDDDVVRIVGIARNVTEQVERERELERTNQRLESLIDAAPLTIMELDPEGNVRRWNDGAEEMFGWTREEVIGEFNPTIQDGKRSEFAEYREMVLSGDRIRGREIERKTSGGERLDLLLSAAPLTGPDGEVTRIIALLDDITEQKQLENRLRALQETARGLSEAQSKAEIGTLAVDAAVDVLGFDITGIWEYDEHEDALVPITETPAARELFGTSPTYTPGDSLAWEAFETGELRAMDDVRSAGDPYNTATQIRSEILVPLGEYGLVSTGSTVAEDFSEMEVDLFQILGATVEAALARASREAELRRQNERLDQFASVVAHDLRNPLSVAKGFLDVAEQSNDPAHFERVASAHDRIERLVDDLLTLARGEPTIEDAERVDIERVATEAWGYVDTSTASLVVDEVPVVAGVPGRLTQLFENLFRNAIEHGGSDVTITVGAGDDDGGFYVADDGVGIPPEKRDEVFDYGVTTNEGGTGFGLSIVADIARAHGWTVSIREGDAGGAHFDFERTE